MEDFGRGTYFVLEHVSNDVIREIVTALYLHTDRAYFVLSYQSINRYILLNGNRWCINLCQSPSMNVVP